MSRAIRSRAVCGASASRRCYTCYDGHEWTMCQDLTPGRLPRVDESLEQWIPTITDSPAGRRPLHCVADIDTRPRS